MFICVHLWTSLSISHARAQEPQSREVVANLAAGRVLVYVSRSAIVIGMIENKIEADTYPPLLAPLHRGRVGVLLGAAEWLTPEGGTPLRLDEDLVRLSGEVAGPKRLQAEHEGDLEALGLALLEPLRNAAGHLHRQIDYPPEEPLLELLLIGYVEGYGPETWSLRYRMVQEPLRGDNWRTRVLRPHYTQLYPPEKGQPRALIEFRYPAGEAAPAAWDQLNSSGALEKFAAAGGELAKAVEQLRKGESHKTTSEGAIEFMRAAMGALARPESAQAIAVIHEREGFEWILAPPERVQRARQQTDEKREPGAPSLRRPPNN
ncbi:MAG TPA: hypothetical protein VGA40_05130 [Candidatus Acidoferrales bacterium]